MSYAKATTLLRLADMAAARHGGVSLADIEQTFGVDRRTAQRLTQALEELFQGVTHRFDAERRKYWRIERADQRLLGARALRDSELFALDMGIRRAEREGAVNEVAALTALRDRLLATLPKSHALRAEADAEAVLEAYGFASRPGPRVRIDPELMGTVAEALKGPHRLTVAYRSQRDAAPRERLLEPHGLLIGVRRYLVAREVGGDGRMNRYRLDRIAWARLEADSFARDPGFRLEDHAARGFGSFHAEAEYGEVVWRFAPHAAEVARGFDFHPTQELTDEADGSLTVRFRASGWLEMTWHLYQWGDAVEVIAPEALRRMVERFRRGDFPALP
jgi:predicted DNA-binding transcriptional regulator YafY